MPIEGNDELLVNRSGTTYTLEQQNLMAEIQGDDLLLVNRSDTTYKVTGQELIDSVVPDLTLTTTFVPNIPYIDQVITAVPKPSGGVEPAGGFVYTYQWSTADDIGGTNKATLIGENSDEYTPTEAQKGKFLGCRIQTTDDRGTTASSEVFVGPIDFKPPTQPPAITSVVLTQDQVNDKRFSSNSFTTTVTTVERATELTLEAQVVGALSLEVGTDLITANDDDGGAPLTLTLASDVNLGNGRFEVGDEVKANETYKPTSARIEEVFTSNYASAIPERPATGKTVDLFNGTYNRNVPGVGYGGANSQGFTFYTREFNDQFKGKTLSWYGYGPDSSGAEIVASYKFVGENEVEIGRRGAGSSDWDWSVVIPVDKELEYVKQITTDRYTRQSRVNYFELDGERLLGSTDTVLTVEDTTDMELFQTGDVVQQTGGVVKTGFDFVEFFGSAAYAPCFDGDPGTFLIAYGAPGIFGEGWAYENVTKVVVQLGTAHSRPQAIGAAINNRALTIGYTDGNGSIGPLTIYNGGPLVFSSLQIEKVPAQNGYDATRQVALAYVDMTQNINGNSVETRLVGTYQNTPTGDVTIVGTDLSAKTITTDGGVWDLTNSAAVWSNTCGANANPANAFDGDLSTAATMPGIKASVTQIPFTAQVIGIYSNGTAESNFTLTVNGVQTYTSTTGTATEGWNYYDLGTPTDIVSLEYDWNAVNITGDAYLIHAVKADGKILVDAFNESFTWSQAPYVVSGASGDGYFDSSKAFEGQKDVTDSSIWQSSAAGEPARWVSNGAFNDATEVTICYRWLTTSGTYKINDVDITGSLSEGTDLIYTQPLASGLQSIEFTKANNGLCWIKVDGVILQDPGTSNVGDSNVKAYYDKQGQGVISDITGDVVSINPFTDNCFVEGQYLIHTAPKPIKITPQTEVITDTSEDNNELTFAGFDELIEFTPGDIAKQVNADGTPAELQYTSSAIIGYDENAIVYSQSKALGPQTYDRDITNNDMSACFNGTQTGPNYIIKNNSWDARYTFEIPADKRRVVEAVRFYHAGGISAYGTFTWFVNYAHETEFSQIGYTPWIEVNDVVQFISHRGVASSAGNIGFFPFAQVQFRYPDGSEETLIDNTDVIRTITFEDNTNLVAFKEGDNLVKGSPTGFNTKLYVGSNPNNEVTGIGFAPDLIWIKDPAIDQDYSLYDTARGVYLNQLVCNNDYAEATDTGGVTGVTPDGFVLTGNNTITGGTNQTGLEYITWCWEKNDSFDITLKTFPSITGNLSFDHNLPGQPEFVIIKPTNISTSSNWSVYHKNAGEDHRLTLNSSTEGVTYGSDIWFPGANTFEAQGNILTAGGQTNIEMVAYMFRSEPGVCSIGTYTGNANANGPVINCGFKPALVMMKDVSLNGEWLVHDTARDPENPSLSSLSWNSNKKTNNPQNIGYDYQCSIDFLSTGFQVTSSTQTLNNKNGNKYVYVAWAAQDVLATILADADTTENTVKVDGGNWDDSDKSQQWGKNTTGSGTFGHIAELIYDGNLNTYAEPLRSGGTTQSLITTVDPPLPANESIRVYKRSDGGAQARIQINDGLEFDLGSNSNRQWIDVPLPNDNLITQIKYIAIWPADPTGDSAEIYGIEVDGRQLIDEVVDTQVWSSAGIIEGTPWGVGSTEWDNAFNGDNSIASGDEVFSSSPGPYTYNFPEPIDCNRLGLFAYKNGGTCKVNVGFGEYTMNLSNGLNQLNELNILEGKLRNIQLTTDTNKGPYLYGIWVDGKQVIDAGARDLGESFASVYKQAEGTVTAVNLDNSTMSLSDSNGGFLPGYYVSTPEKNAVEMRGYLSFDSEGNNVDLERLPQPPVLMGNVNTPKLTFPSTFSTGEGVDTDLPFPTYLETYVQASNDLGSSLRVKSNELFPNWTGRPYIAPGSYRVMQDEFAEWCYWACSSDYRAAVKTIQDAEETVQELRTKAENMALNFLNRDDVY